MAQSATKLGIINCHSHVMTSYGLPYQLFLHPLPLLPLLRVPWIRWLLVMPLYFFSWLLGLIGFDKPLHWLEEHSERVFSVVAMSKYRHQSDIFNILAQYYPHDTKFVVLALDTAYMGKGKWGIQKYAEQLKELKELKEAHGNKILPFVHADPRRKGVTDLVVKCLEEDGFHGIKIYPPFGVLPADQGLDAVYKYAVKHNIPVIGHCTPGGMRGSHYQENGNIFADPDNYKALLDKFPTLKLCLAHFGGNSEWEKYLNEPWKEGDEESWVSKIINLINLNNKNGKPKYPNLYVDISYVAYHPSTRAYLKVLLGADEHKRLQDRILFGSDFYVLQSDIAERAFSIGLRGDIGEEKFDLIARINPRKFLNIPN